MNMLDCHVGFTLTMALIILGFCCVAKMKL